MLQCRPTDGTSYIHGRTLRDVEKACPRARVSTRRFRIASCALAVPSHHGPRPASGLSGPSPSHPWDTAIANPFSWPRRIRRRPLAPRPALFLFIVSLSFFSHPIFLRGKPTAFSFIIVACFVCLSRLGLAYRIWPLSPVSSSPVLALDPEEDVVSSQRASQPTPNQQQQNSFGCVYSHYCSTIITAGAGLLHHPCHAQLHHIHLITRPQTPSPCLLWQSTCPSTSPFRRHLLSDPALLPS